MMCRWTHRGAERLTRPGALSRPEHLGGWFQHDGRVAAWLDGVPAGMARGPAARRPADRRIGGRQPQPRPWARGSLRRGLRAPGRPRIGSAYRPLCFRRVCRQISRKPSKDFGKPSQDKRKQSKIRRKGIQTFLFRESRAFSMGCGESRSKNRACLRPGFSAASRLPFLPAPERRAAGFAMTSLAPPKRNMH